MMDLVDFRNLNELKLLQFDDEKIPTRTSKEQIETEKKIQKCFDRYEQLQFIDFHLSEIYREQHIQYLLKYLQNLPAHYDCLDSSRPWNVYWILNAAHTLNFKFSEESENDIVDFLTRCRSKEGGFGGGPGQYPHLATTYASINSLCIIGTENAYKAVDRESLKNFLLACRCDDGSFRLQVEGETDVRGAYCAISCAKLLNFSEDDEKTIFKDTADWIVKCQTYEGGFGGAPDLEAHGGYTFCGISSLVMLGASEKCNSELLLKWALSRQMKYEGGFQGRTNKLVDGCYSFWVGAAISIAQAIIAKNDISLASLMKTSMFDRAALQEYILLCCQKPNGGLIDKPGKPQDLYHTCYTLSGTSIAQHCEASMSPLILGDPSNELLPVHPVHNVPPMAVVKAYMYFKSINDLVQKNTNNSNEDFIKNSYDSSKNIADQSNLTQKGMD